MVMFSPAHPLTHSPLSLLRLRVAAREPVQNRSPAFARVRPPPVLARFDLRAVLDVAVRIGDVDSAPVERAAGDAYVAAMVGNIMEYGRLGRSRGNGQCKRRDGDIVLHLR